MSNLLVDQGLIPSRLLTVTGILASEEQGGTLIVRALRADPN